MDSDWYRLRDGEEDGPFSYAVLKMMAAKGDLLATDQLRAGTTQEWRQASNFPDLFVTVESRCVFSNPSSLGGLTMALGIEPAKPGEDSLLGCDIGGVEIIRLIAEGGMGRVYEGKQEKPNRTVAVKVMRPGLTSPSILKRFEYEAEVLGRLQHPGIANIYSVGVHRMGNATVPYFVMEYIADARTVIQYAEDLKLPTRQRLDLFRSVCAAVAHGHRKGVIHRDLKPSNILVDATGQPKVIDFGVARATDSDMALTTMQTDVGQLIGTLQYMSPEQFDANPNDIDIRSDVYALGVILYELLAGKMPYDVKKKAIYEVMRIVKEEEPPPLSSLNRALKGDVAVIAAKCLEKDRNRRYSSASELGSDVGRYLAGDPISASAPSFVDGLVRLAKKHRVAATALAGMFLSLVLAIVGISVSALWAEQQRELAVAQSDRAKKSEQDAEQARAKAEERLRQADAARREAEKARADADEKQKQAEAAQEQARHQKEVAQAASQSKVKAEEEQKAAMSKVDHFLTAIVSAARKWASTLRQIDLLNKETDLSPEVAKHLVNGLAKHGVKVPLLLDSLTTLSRETALELARYPGELRLTGLSILPVDAATALATHKGVLVISDAADAAKEALRQHKQVKIEKAKAVRGESVGLTSPNLAASLAKGLRPESRYGGMLGRFISAARRGQPADASTFNTPYIFLRVPSGDNVLCQRAQAAFQNHPAGQPTFGHLWFNFVTEGRFELMQDTTVVIKAGGACGIILDGKDVTPPGYGDRALSFELALGLHTVVLYSGNNGGQLGGASIKITEKNGKLIAPWFTGQDFEDFVRRFGDSHEVVEVSGWSAR